MKEGSKNKKIGLFFIGGLVAVIILLVVIIVLLMRKPAEVPEVPDASEEPRRSVVVTQDTVDDLVENMLQGDYVAPGYYSVSMTTTWHFAKGDGISEDARVDNLAENTNDVYFDVFLADNEGEAIYQSPLLPRGSSLNDIALDTVLSAGTYDCVMVYHLVDEEQNTLSTLRVAFTIVVDA
ncbi:MAG: hypothetical protein J1E64_02060 [Acetatifactor sp.]|nr:hypothetical protein [Acetatifactor sp.]